MANESPPAPAPAPEIAPWLDPIWERLSRAVAANRVPHALLLHGSRGVGKRSLAAALREALLCGSRDSAGRGCGGCRSCRLLAAGSHPDTWWIAPAEPEGQLTIDRIRELSAKLALTSHAATRKVAVLEPAERLNRSAANALLKTLEEPPGTSTLILVSDAPSRLPATVRSRCQALGCPVPDRSLALSWLTAHPGDAARRLDFADGAPLEALRLATAVGGAIDAVREACLGLADGRVDPLAGARAIRAAGECRLSLRVAEGLLRELIRLKFALSVPASEQDLRNLMKIANRIDFPTLYSLADSAQAARRSFDAGISLNEQLVIEELAVSWWGLSRAGSGTH